MKKERLGKLYVDAKIIESKEFANALALLKFVPVRVEMLWYINRFEYIGYSELFKPLRRGAITPTYEIEYSDNHITVHLKE